MTRKQRDAICKTIAQSTLGWEMTAPTVYAAIEIACRVMNAGKDASIIDIQTWAVEQYGTISTDAIRADWD